jgi:hypothetical protein
MVERTGRAEWQERMARLARAQRQGPQEESTRVTASGASVPAWLIEVTGHVEYNLYEVRQVRIVMAGITPLALGGSTTQAFNVAESFTAAGSLSAGTFAVMWRVGEKNVIQVKP